MEQVNMARAYFLRGMRPSGVTWSLSLVYLLAEKEVSHHFKRCWKQNVSTVGWIRQTIKISRSVPGWCNGTMFLFRHFPGISFMPSSAVPLHISLAPLLSTAEIVFAWFLSHIKCGCVLGLASFPQFLRSIFILFSDHGLFIRNSQRI